MRKAYRNNKKREHTSSDEEKLYRLKELCHVDLRGKVEIMAGFAQELIRIGPASLFLAAVVKGDSFFFFPAQLGSDYEKRALQHQVIEVATANTADCLVSASIAWAAPHDSSLRPSMNPARQEVIAVIAKDHFEHVAAMQDIHRHGNEVTFGELEIFSSVQSWLDDYPGFDKEVASC